MLTKLLNMFGLYTRSQVETVYERGREYNEIDVSFDQSYGRFLIVGHKSRPGLAGLFAREGKYKFYTGRYGDDQIKNAKELLDGSGYGNANVYRLINNNGQMVAKAMNMYEDKEKRIRELIDKLEPDEDFEGEGQYKSWYRTCYGDGLTFDDKLLIRDLLWGIGIGNH